MKPCIRRLQTVVAGRLVPAYLVLAMMQAMALADQGAQNIASSQNATRPSVDGPNQSTDNSLSLKPGAPIQREIALNETHSYRIALVAGQYLNVMIDQAEADIGIRWLGPDGKRLGMIGRIMTAVPTSVSLIADTTGEHRVEVSYVKVPLSTKRGTKRYQVRIRELRAATPEDVGRLSMRSPHFLEGLRLLQEDTPESRQKAFEQFEEFLRGLRLFGDRGAEARELSGLAAMFSTREPQKALYFGQQALAIWRDLGEVPSQISVLVVCGVNYEVLGKLDNQLNSYTEALTLSRNIGDRYGELNTLHHLRSFYIKLNDKQKVAQISTELEPLSRALAAEEKAALPSERAAALQKRREARDLVKRGTPASRQTAFELYGAALQLFRSVGDREGEVETLISLGRVTAQLGDQKKALDYIEQAVHSVRANKTLYELGYSLQMLYLVAEAYEDLDEKLKAIDIYIFMIEIWRARKPSLGAPDLHLTVSRLYDSLGDKVKALEHLNSTLLLLQSQCCVLRRQAYA